MCVCVCVSACMWGFAGVCACVCVCVCVNCPKPATDTKVNILFTVLTRLSIFSGTGSIYNQPLQAGFIFYVI